MKIMKNIYRSIIGAPARRVLRSSLAGRARRGLRGLALAALPLALLVAGPVQAQQLKLTPLPGGSVAAVLSVGAGAAFGFMAASVGSRPAGAVTLTCPR